MDDLFICPLCSCDFADCTCVTDAMIDVPEDADMRSVEEELDRRFWEMLENTMKRE